ncbi:MAG: hypothetical protein LAT76_11855, partial [Schleiferiaceae bacterium]|nr:hypothetical protein [Schleiferiaceae bacterium]
PWFRRGIGKRRFLEGFMPSAGVYRCAGCALARSLLRSPGGSQFMEGVWETQEDRSFIEKPPTQI